MPLAPTTSVRALRVAAGVSIGLAALASLIASQVADSTLGATLSIAAISVIVLEATRVSLGVRPWWIAYLAVGPWAAIVLLPWVYFTIVGSWPAVGTIVDPHLGHTWGFHLLVLVGMVAGTIVGMAGVARPADSARLRVDWRRVSRVNAWLVTIYVVGSVASGRPVSQIWTLGGGLAYGQSTGDSAFLFLIGLPVAGSVLLLIASAARRRVRVRPLGVEVAWLATLGLVTLGSGVRQYFFLLVFGWLLIQLGPAVAHGSPGTRLRVLVIAGVMLAVSIPTANLIAELRSGGSYGPGNSPVGYAVQTVDVVGSGEALFAAGARPGMLAGRSYTQLPVLLVPRSILGSAKPDSAADGVVRAYLSPSAGYTAPLWLEAALNFGAVGVLFFGVLYGAGVVWIVLRVRRSRQALGRTAALLGPVWIIVSYIVLARLTLYGTLFSVTSIALGIALASRCVTLAPMPGQPAERIVEGIGPNRLAPRP